jgi:hypothetical protein
MLAKDREEHDHVEIDTGGRITRLLTSCSACCHGLRRRRPPSGAAAAGAAGAGTGAQATGGGLGARFREFFMARTDTLGKMVTERERELERELEMAELETWGALNGGWVCMHVVVVLLCVGVDGSRMRRALP